MRSRGKAAKGKRETTPRPAGLDALRAESDRHHLDQIRRLLARPMAERTHFLRKRVPGGGSHV